MKQIRLKKLFVIMLTLTISGIIWGQQNKKSDRVYWNERKKLIIDDFGKQTKHMENGATTADFVIEYQVSKLHFSTKNFNKRVRHFMVKQTSQIDITGNIEHFLLYQQTLFNLSEVYAREFRKALRENRKLLIRGTRVADELNWKIMSEFMERKTIYNLETNSGHNKLKQKEWEDIIAYELNELKDYAYDI